MDVSSSSFSTRTVQLSLEGIENFLVSTPTIRNFDPIKDEEIVKRIKEKFITDKGIMVEQNRLLLKGRKL
jgi:hypothetical protein